MRKGIQIKTIRNLNLDHPGGKCQILTIRGGIEGNEEVNPPRMVKIQHFPPGWSRFRFLMVLIWIPFLISPPDGQDLAQICSKCQLQFLRLMALPVIEESSYLGLPLLLSAALSCLHISSHAAPPVLRHRLEGWSKRPWTMYAQPVRRASRPAAADIACPPRRYQKVDFRLACHG